MTELCFEENHMGSSSIEATRELCDDLDSLLEVAKQSCVSIRAISLIEKARADLQAHLDEIDSTASRQLRLLELTIRNDETQERA